MLSRIDFVGLIKSLSSFAKIKSALCVVEEVALLGSNAIRDDGLRFDFSLAVLVSLVDPVEANVPDMDVLGVTKEISMFVVELTELRLAFGRPLKDGSEAVVGVIVSVSAGAERETVEKRLSSSIFSLFSSGSFPVVDDEEDNIAACVGVSAVVGDSSASTIGLESFVGLGVFGSKEDSELGVCATSGLD